MLDNATAYTAFQTDLYLPDGLTLLQEDGDYLIDLTARKARDHNIASQLQTDGSIRIMSYSPRIFAEAVASYCCSDPRGRFLSLKCVAFCYTETVPG